MNNPDINFYFDPLCPFAWMASKWVRQVAAQRDYTANWRFISLRMLRDERGIRAFVEPLLKRAVLPAALADALDDANWDGELRAETDEALALTGKDVGYPDPSLREASGQRNRSCPAVRGQACSCPGPK